jgi:olfactory receptor
MPFISCLKHLGLESEFYLDSSMLDSRSSSEASVKLQKCEFLEDTFQAYPQIEMVKCQTLFEVHKSKIERISFWFLCCFIYSNKLFTFERCPGYMKPQNLTGILEYQLLGLSINPELHPLFFGLFLTMYVVTVFGNLLIILAVRSDSHLHNPMYFFLSNLSLADIGFSSTTIPKMLVNIQTHNKSITYLGCLNQVTFFVLFGCLDSLLLSVMSYDQLVAICYPLNYPVIMNPCLCGLLILVSLSFSLLDSQLHCMMISHLLL